MPPFFKHLPLLALLLPAAAGAQAGPRTDTPRAWTLRLTFEPVITTWEREFTADGRERQVGASLFSETKPPLECTAVGVVVCRYLFAPVFVHVEQRVTPFALELGITNRLAIGAKVPVVRVSTRESYPLDSLGQVGFTRGADRVDSLLQDTTYALAPIVDTKRRLRYFAGDVELQAKYRFLETPRYALSAALLVRLPTGHQDSPDDLFDVSTGDHQRDIELQVAQELTLLNRLWLNALVRAGRQQPGTRTRRVGPQSVLLIPHAALATLAWDPGDYLAIDVAPMYRFSQSFGIGFTGGYYTQTRDRYAYRAAQDSTDIAARLGSPVAASVLNGGTAVRWTRLGVAVTYVGSDVEGSLSFEQTVKAAGGLVPVATVFRIVMRTSRWPF